MEVRKTMSSISASARDKFWVGKWKKNQITSRICSGIFSSLKSGTRVTYTFLPMYAVYLISCSTLWFTHAFSQYYLEVLFESHYLLVGISQAHANALILTGSGNKWWVSSVASGICLLVPLYSTSHGLKFSDFVPPRWQILIMIFIILDIPILYTSMIDICAW